MTPSSFVTHLECKRYHKGTRLFFAFIAICGSLFVVAGVWSVSQGWLARCEAAIAKQAIEVHVARDEESEKSINKTLERLEKAIDKLIDETKKLAERHP